jgi:hypothetical protein
MRNNKPRPPEAVASFSKKIFLFRLIEPNGIVKNDEAISDCKSRILAGQKENIH